jgi:hypothetical protein
MGAVWPVSGMTAFETESVECCRSLGMDQADLFHPVLLVEIRPEGARKVHLISTNPGGAPRQPESLSSASDLALSPRELPLVLDGVVPDHRHRIAGFGEEELEHHV